MLRRHFLMLGAAAVFGRFTTACRNAATRSSAMPSQAWATGGTAAMTAKSSYPNPFATSAASKCAMTCELTEGPCYDATSALRQDISYGYAGLPMRVQLQLLDEMCKPVSGALVDVWHVSPVGKYSGKDAAHEDVGFCTDNDAEFTTHLYFRGKQVSDANGVVTFDTCFPGWYRGRTIHVHLTVSIGGVKSVTSQLCFDDALGDDILESQTIYASRGARDTKNANDGVYSPSTFKDYQFETAKMIDGAILAWKTVILRSVLSEAICAPAGRSGGPPPGGAGFPRGQRPSGPPPDGSRPQ